MRTGLVSIAVLLFLNGCSHVKEFAPIRIAPMYPRVPNQQRLISQSTLQAVEKAASGINLAQYAGKKIRVEVNGVFPHSEEDLLNYVAAAVEGEAARAGAMVLPRPDPRFVTDKVILSYSASDVAASPGSGYGTQTPNPTPTQRPVEEQPDVRLVASVDWGGIDLKDHKYIKGGQLIGSILLSLPLLTLPIVIIWNLVSPIYGHTFTMIGRVRVTLRAIPVSPGLAAAAATGEGESSVVVDPDSDTGYMLIMPLPREAGDVYQRRAQ